MTPCSRLPTIIGWHHVDKWSFGVGRGVKPLVLQGFKSVRRGFVSGEAFLFEAEVKRR